MYWQGESVKRAAQAILSHTSSLALALPAHGVLPLLPCVPVPSRTVYYREKAGGTYGTIPYAIAEFAVEIPYLIVQAVVYSVIVYFMIGFKSEAGAFFWFLLMMMLTLAYWTYFGIQNVHITPSLQIANAFTSFAFGVWDLMCGFYSPKPLIPSGWIWVSHCSCPRALGELSSKAHTLLQPAWCSSVAGQRQGLCTLFLPFYLSG